MSNAAFRGLALLVVAAALLLRLPALGLRPMHHDEANQALKLGRLLETGEYRYDPTDHHGPSLYYFSWVLARAEGRTTLAALDEADLRLLPALFGAATVLLLIAFAGALGRPAALAAGALAAVSPAFAYYSRFYIQESIFVFLIAAFALASWRWRARPSAGRAILAGAAAGLMFATKETSVIVFAAVAVAAAGTRLLAGTARVAPGAKRPSPLRDLAWGAGAAGVTAALFFSSFFRHPRGVLDAILAFPGYVAKSGDPGFHAHPAGYYFGLLTYSKSGGLVWSEALVLALACLGIIAAIRTRESFRVAAALASLTAAAAFSLIPYKTPWNALPFYIGFVLLAGAGADFIFRRLRGAPAKAAAGILLGAGLLNLAWQSGLANFRYPADPRNPYVYAQTVPDYQRLVKRLDELTPYLPGKERALIKVVCGPYETWPLPWSLRRHPNAGYWTDAASAGFGPGAEAGRDAAAPAAAALIIASEDQAAKLGPILEDAYHAEFYGLRPDVILTLFVANEPWERFLSERRR